MIRKFEKNDINAVMEIRIKENKDNLTLNVYKKNANAIKFYEKNNFIITSNNIDKDTNEIEYTMTWSK